jgi:hypothetical protein
VARKAAAAMIVDRRDMMLVLLVVVVSYNDSFGMLKRCVENVNDLALLVV